MDADEGNLNCFEIEKIFLKSQPDSYQPKDQTILIFKSLAVKYYLRVSYLYLLFHF